MKVLLVNDGDRGGSVIAMTRLHEGLKKVGVDSKILNRVNSHSSADIITIPRSQTRRWAEYQLEKVTWRLGLTDIHCLNTFSIKNLPDYLDADITDFHTIHGGFFNYLALPGLTRSKPGVFTLHDMWFFTGHCSYSFDCERWKTGCGRCPHLDAYPPVRRDGSRLEWKLKDRVYSKSNVAVVSPSRWLAEQAAQSMLNRFAIHYIPHGIDTNIYRPLNREHCRSILGIPAERKVLSFIAMRMDQSDEHTFRKGCDLLVGALKGLPEKLKSETTLLLVGDRAGSLAEAVGIQTLDLGYISSDHLKAVAYSASDLFLFPSRADIFGLVLLESMACGTPMVSFRVGGVTELVRPGITGYLAEAEDVDDFREGIVKLLSDESLRNYMSQQCREIAVQEYTLQLQVQRYMNLYQQLLQRPIQQ
jgi:glycosyltransferase involved in cell wall biosynthesis